MTELEKESSESVSIFNPAVEDKLRYKFTLTHRTDMNLDTSFGFQIYNIIYSETGYVAHTELAYEMVGAAAESSSISLHVGGDECVDRETLGPYFKASVTWLLWEEPIAKVNGTKSPADFEACNGTALDMARWFEVMMTSAISYVKVVAATTSLELYNYHVNAKYRIINGKYNAN